MESPSPGPTSPQMIWRPRCSMNPVIMPALPPTTIVPPFWSIPVRAPTSPRITRSPPRSAAPASEPAFLSITTTPDIMFSATDHPTRPVIRISGRVGWSVAEVAEAAIDGDPAPGKNAHRDGVLRARIEDGHIRDFLGVDQTAQLCVDLAGREVGGIEYRLSPAALAF